MRGDNHLLALTTATDEVTGEVKPLFAFPIQVCKATASVDVKIDTATPSGAPTEGLKRVDPATGEVFDYADLQHGVRVGDEFRLIPEESLKQIGEATKIKTMTALGQMPLKDVPFERATGTYFLQSPAKGGSPKAYRLTYEALLKTKAAIITKRTARSRQKLAVIYADKDLGCLVMIEVRFAAELRSPDEQILAPQTAQVEAKQVALATQVIEAMGDGRAVLDTEVDEAIALKQELVDKALDGEAIVAPPKAIAETVETDDLNAALEASLAAS